MSDKAFSEQEETLDSIRSWRGVTSFGASWLLYQGDVRECLDEISDQSINCVITSPPYFWLRDYQVNNQIGLEDSVQEYVDAISSTMEGIFRILKPDGTLFLNLGDTYYSGKGKSHGNDPKSSKRRFGLRAVDKSGGLDINIRPKSAIGIPWRVAIEMCKRTWVLRSAIIWNRQYALPESVKDRL